MKGMRFRGIWYVVWKGLLLPSGRTIEESLEYYRRLCEVGGGEKQ